MVDLAKVSAIDTGLAIAVVIMAMVRAAIATATVLTDKGDHKKAIPLIETITGPDILAIQI